MSTSREKWANQLADAHQNGIAKPNLPKPCSIEEAYEIQRAMVKALGSEIVGYKGALSGRAAQDAFGVKAPLVGALTSDSEVASGFSLASMVMPMLEVELSVPLIRDVVEPITRDQLIDTFGSCCMSIELAEVAFNSRPSAADLTAGNSAAGRFLLGGQLATRDMDHIQITLEREGEVINQGMSGELGSQLELALTLANIALAAGYSLTKGMHLMTGSIGQILPAVPGKYTATFSQPDTDQRDNLTFTLEA